MSTQPRPGDAPAQPATPALPDDPGPIAGERGIPSVNRIRSIQSRVTTVFAIALMGAIGAGLLVWYYSHALTRQQRVTRTAQTASEQKAKGEMALPPLGHVTPPRVASSAPPVSKQPDAVFGSAPPVPPELLAASATNPEPVPARAAVDGATPAPRTPQKSAAQLAFERRLSGPVFSPTAGTSAPLIAALARNENSTSALVAALSAAQMNSATAAGGTAAAAPVDSMTTLLKPTATPAVAAQVLPTQRFLLPRGAFIDCTLETAIDSTLPGLTTCVTATDVFGADGSTVLLERGSKLTGETRGEVRQGAARVFVLWTEARTPTGVVIALASPGTDELGRSGLPGEVDRHFFERFGAAMLITVLEGAVQAAASRSSGSGVVVLNPTTSAQIPEEVLRSTINIPPTVRKQNGDRIQVLVARDLDFRSVYDLRPTAAPR